MALGDEEASVPPASVGAKDGFYVEGMFDESACMVCVGRCGAAKMCPIVGDGGGHSEIEEQCPTPKGRMLVASIV